MVVLLLNHAIILPQSYNNHHNDGNTIFIVYITLKIESNHNFAISRLVRCCFFSAHFNIITAFCYEAYMVAFLLSECREWNDIIF